MKEIIEEARPNWINDGVELLHLDLNDPNQKVIDFKDFYRVGCLNKKGDKFIPCKIGDYFSRLSG